MIKLKYFNFVIKNIEIDRQYFPENTTSHMYGSKNNLL